MVHTAVYFVEAKPSLVEWLKQSNSDLLKCLQGPFLWTAQEDGYSLESERLAKFKVLFFLWLVWSYSTLMESLPPGSTVSLSTFDDLWSARRFSVEGDLADLQSGFANYKFSAVFPTGNRAIDGWVQEMKELTQSVTTKLRRKTEHGSL